MKKPIRFMPCSLVVNLKTGRMYIVQYDYTYAHGVWNSGSNFRDLSLYHLDKDGDIVNCSAWHDGNEFELVDLPKPEYFDKITQYELKLYKEVANPISFDTINIR